MYIKNIHRRRYKFSYQLVILTSSGSSARTAFLFLCTTLCMFDQYCNIAWAPWQFFPGEKDVLDALAVWGQNCIWHENMRLIHRTGRKCHCWSTLMRYWSHLWPTCSLKQLMPAQFLRVLTRDHHFLLSILILFTMWYKKKSWSTNSAFTLQCIFDFSFCCSWLSYYLIYTTWPKVCGCTAKIV